MTGDVQESELAGFIEGLVNGEVFRWRLNSSRSRATSITSSVSYSGEATVTIDEMSSHPDGFSLHFVSASGDYRSHQREAADVVI